MDPIILGTNGNDVLNGTNNGEIIKGLGGDDAIYGLYGNDVIEGGEGNDYIDGGYGLDKMDGGAGVDTMDVSFYPDTYELDMTTGMTNFAGETAINFENVFTGAGNDKIVGNDENNYISTGAGDDWVSGGYGADLMQGGLGTDTVDYTFWNGSLMVNLETGDTDTVGEFAFDFENINTGAGDDVIYGTSGANVINTGEGNDTVFAGAGNDMINAYGNKENNSTQIDHLYGGEGKDVFVLGTASGGVFYQEPGDGYAVVADWNGGMVRDKIQLKGNASDYKVEFKNVSGIGGSAMDTEIYYGHERIAILQDTRDFQLNSSCVDFV
jgi:serralysin